MISILLAIPRLLNYDRLARNYSPCLGHGKYVFFFKGVVGRVTIQGPRTYERKEREPFIHHTYLLLFSVYNNMT